MFPRGAGLAVALVLGTLGAADAQTTRPSLFTSELRGARQAISRAGTARSRLVALRADLMTAALDSSTGADAPFLLNLFDDVTFALRRVRVDAATRDHRSWIGTSGANDEIVAALTLGPAGLSGGVTAFGVSYALEPTPSGDVLIRELAPVAAPPELPAQRLGGRDSLPAAVTGAAAGSPPRIDLLVLYTPGARGRAGGVAQIEASLANAVAVTNTALQRSAVDATLMTAALEELPYVESSSGITYDLFALAAGGALHARVEARRAAVGADLVALVVGRTTPAAGCGVAYLGPSPNAIYSVTEEACLFAGQWSLSHELGHNLGADHAPGDPVVSPVPYARGYRDTAVRTLMAYAAPGAPQRILNYSSSSVREPALTGVATGNSLQDNARRLAETAATVAAFSAAAAAPDVPDTLTASVIGGTVTLTWEAPTTGGAVTGYLLEAGLAPRGSTLGPFGTHAPGMVFQNVPPGRYYTRIRSIGPGGTSAPSEDTIVDVTSSCAVPGPATVTATVSPGQAALQWFAPPGNGETRYEVGVGSAPGLLDLGVFAVGTLTAASVPAPPGRYVVRARGVNACGPGGASAELIVVVP